MPATGEPGPARTGAKGAAWRGWIEMLAAYAAAIGLNYAVAPYDPAFLELHLHPYLVLTMAFALRYGLAVGSAAGVVGSALVLAAHAWRGDLLLRDFLFSFNDLALPFSLVLLGVLVGQSVHSRAKRTDYYREALRRETQAREALARQQEELRQSAVQMEKRLAGQAFGIQDFSDSLLATFDLDREGIYRHVQGMLRKFLRAERSLVLLSDPDVYHQRAVNHEGPVPDAEEVARVQSGRLYNEALFGVKAVALTDFLDAAARSGEDAPVLFCGPVIGREGRVDAVVAVTAMPFIHFNITNFRLFRVMLRAAGEALRVLEARERLREAMPYHERLPVERQGWFLKELLLQLQWRERIPIAVAGFAGEQAMPAGRRDRLLVLLAGLCQHDHLRVGFLEDGRFLALYTEDGHDETLGTLHLRERFEVYGLGQAARLVYGRATLERRHGSREEGYTLRLLEQAFAKARDLSVQPAGDHQEITPSPPRHQDTKNS